MVRHLAPTIRDQIQLIPAPEAAFEGYGLQVAAELLPAVSAPVEEPAGPLSERIKASVTVLEFVGRYVDLEPTKSGAVGRCPFHADHRPSFGVNDEGNYWHCFAGCGGGAVTDFWMRWRGSDFTMGERDTSHCTLFQSIGAQTPELGLFAAVKSETERPGTDRHTEQLRSFISSWL